MDHNDKKLEFLHKIATLGLKHYDGGGLIGGLGSALGTNNSFTPQGAPSQEQMTTSLNQSNTAIQGAQNLANMTLPGITQGLGSQNALASQLMAMTQGQGPNPAQNQLAQATGANVANQAALMAGQRGSGSNVGLLARQNAMQGAGIQQNAAGQAATLGAQQQINAQNNLANLSAQQVGQAGQAQGLFNTAAGTQLNTLENANAAYNTTGASIGAGNAKNAQGLLGGIVGGLTGGLGLAKGGKVSRMSDGGEMSSWQGEPDSDDSDKDDKSKGGMGSGGGPAGLIKSIAPLAALLKDGGTAIEAPMVQMPMQGSWIGNYLNGGPMAGYQDSGDSNDNAFSEGMKSGSKISKGALKGINKIRGPIGEQVGTPGTSDAIDSGGLAGISEMAAKGGEIRQMSSKGDVVKAKAKSEKAIKPGNSYANDKIPAMLSEGEVVIDRNTLEDKGPIGQMARALRQHIEQRNKSR